jgi:hypothetical protein
MRPFFRRRADWPALALAAGLPALAAACSSATGSQQDSRACPQTYEFGNYGCLEVVGQVLGSSEQPLAGIVVGPRFVQASAGFNTPYATTNDEGRFTLRVTRYGPRESPAAGPDTVSLYVLAVDPRSAGVNVTATVRDSVLVRAAVAPVGAVPVAQSVTMRLAAP